VKSIKELQTEIKELKATINEQSREIQALAQDRQKFRDYWVAKMKWFIELHGKNQTPNMAWLVEDMARLMNRVERWFW
jgi:hypothetical protein